MVWSARRGTLAHPSPTLARKEDSSTCEGRGDGYSLHLPFRGPSIIGGVVAQPPAVATHKYEIALHKCVRSMRLRSSIIHEPGTLLGLRPWLARWGFTSLGGSGDFILICAHLPLCHTTPCAHPLSSRLSDTRRRSIGRSCTAGKP